MTYTNPPEQLELMKEELGKNKFRVAIFGSARTKPNEPAYKKAFELAKALSEMEIDVVTGGGPGIMEAANAGHNAGDNDNDSTNFGLTIRLPFEAQGNKYLEIREHFQDFSDRLDRFVDLAQAFVIMPGGIGTCLELFYVWQLAQVKHIKPVPIILYGKLWEDLIEWVRKNLLGRRLISPNDIDFIHIAHSKEDVLRLVKKFRKDCEN